MQEQKEDLCSSFVKSDLLEMGRQLLQSCVLSRELGSLFPKQQDLSGIHDVLDLACGPGSWTLEAANTFTQIHFTGVDIDPVVLDYAQARKWAIGKTNMDFKVMDVTESFLLEENSFDLIYGRFLFGFMHREDWPKMIAECQRVLRPGGTLLLTEGETWVKSQSPAIVKLSRYVYQALWLSGQAFCADGLGIGVSHLLGFFLEEAGYELVDMQGYAINISYGARAYPAMVQDTMLLMKCLQPFLERAGVATAEELEQLYSQGMEEIRHKTYRALWHITQVSGRKSFR